jgi:hypothetical protein
LDQPLSIFLHFGVLLLQPQYHLTKFNHGLRKKLPHPLLLEDGCVHVVSDFFHGAKIAIFPDKTKPILHKAK